jgi:ABC-type antimicrobial peptide transport system permease subunit
VLVRTAGEAGPAVVVGLRAEIEAMGREYPLRVETIDRAIDRALSQERMMASLAGAYGFLALVLAALGLGASMANSVSRRRREIGIRMALGARPRQIAAAFLRECSLPVAAGFAIGAPAAYAIWSIARSRLYGLQTPDPAATGLAAAILVLVLAVAAFLPAQRAARIDPASSLRAE